MRKVYGSADNGRADGNGRGRMPKFPGRIIAICVSLAAVFCAIWADRSGYMPAMWAGYAVMVGGVGYICYWFVKLGYSSRAIQMGIMTALIGAMFGLSQYFLSEMNALTGATEAEATSSLAAEAGEWHAPLYSRAGFIIMVAAMVIRIILSFYRVYVLAREGKERAWQLRRRLQPVRIALVIIILIGITLLII